MADHEHGELSQLSNLSHLSDAELIAHVAEVCLAGHRLTARLLVYLGEVEERRLDLRAACSSMFDYCVRRLGMSKGAAYRRITAARLLRQFPRLFGPNERGELHMSTLVLLRPHVSESNVDELVAMVLGKTHREVEELVARIAPRPDVPSRIRALGCAPQEAPASATPLLSAAAAGDGDVPLATMGVEPPPEREARFAVQLTASQSLRDKLERARDLMRHGNPSGDLAVVIERALDEFLVTLERKRLAKRRRPHASTTATPTARETKPRRAPRAVPRAVRREAFERDGEQCTFVAEDGARCPSRTLLELDHAVSRALGGADDASNLRVRCRAHNRLHAEDVLGKEHVASCIEDLRRLRHQRSDASRGVARVTPAPQALGVDLDAALRGLLNLGFARSDARRALDGVARRHANDHAPLHVAEIVREAVAALT